MTERSFWERVGRGLGYGWQKAKEVGARLEDKAEEGLEMRLARDRLQELHEELGRAVAARVIGEEEQPLDLSGPPFVDLIEGIRSEAEEVARLEKLHPKDPAKDPTDGPDA